MSECRFIAEDVSGERADKYLARLFPSLSRNYLQNCFAKGLVSVNGASARKSLPLFDGDEIAFDCPEPEKPTAEPENIPIEIVYEDDYLLVVNKPKGMVVHPAPGNRSGTLVNALLFHCGERLSGINGVLRPGIVHRIDKNTSGLLAVAKTDAAHEGLSALIKEHDFDREYLAVTVGLPENDSFSVSLPVGRDSRDRTKMAVTDKNSKEARTDVTVVTLFKKNALIRCRLYTGRTHQIRVHLAYTGTPLLGDEVYGGVRARFPGLDGQCLHAALLGFVHPITGEKLTFEAPLPDYFKKVLTKLK